MRRKRPACRNRVASRSCFSEIDPSAICSAFLLLFYILFLDSNRNYHILTSYELGFSHYLILRNDSIKTRFKSLIVVAVSRIYSRKGGENCLVIDRTKRRKSRTRGHFNWRRTIDRSRDSHTCLSLARGKERNDRNYKSRGCFYSRRGRTCTRRVAKVASTCPRRDVAHWLSRGRKQRRMGTRHLFAFLSRRCPCLLRMTVGRTGRSNVSLSHSPTIDLPDVWFHFETLLHSQNVCNCCLLTMFSFFLSLLPFKIIPLSTVLRMLQINWHEIARNPGNSYFYHQRSSNLGSNVNISCSSFTFTFSSFVLFHFFPFLDRSFSNKFLRAAKLTTYFKR